MTTASLYDRNGARLAICTIKRSLFAICALLALMGAAPSRGFADAATRPGAPARTMIEIVDDHASELDWNAIIKALVPAREDGWTTDIDPDAVETILTDFGTVSRQTIITDREKRVTLRFHPFKRIKTITVKGNYPLFEKEVRNALTVASGSFFQAADMAGQQTLVEKLYRDQGYINPRVRITWRREQPHGHYLLTVAIDKGPYFKVGGLTLQGHAAFTQAELKSAMTTWRKFIGTIGAGRFVESQLTADLNQLRDYYRKKGYADVHVAASTRADPEAEKVFIAITVEEGPHYHVSLTGNDFFSTFSLEQDVILKKIGNRGNLGLRRSVETIRRRYLEAGFADVSVRWRDTTPKTDRHRNSSRRIAMEIKEGQRFLVNTLVIEGNRGLDAEEVKGQFLTRPASTITSGAYVADRLAEDLDAARALYVKHGYLDARISHDIRINPQNKKVDIIISIVEGVRTRIGQIAISGQPPNADQDLRAGLQLAPGALYRPYLMPADENELSSRVAALGYPHVQVRGSAVLSDDGRRADITYTIDPGPLVKVGSIFFTGNFRTKNKVLSREMAVAPGDAFSLQKVLKSQSNLRNLGLFDSVQVRSIGLKEKDPTVHLMVQAVEKKPYALELGLGYQTDKGAYARTRIEDNNLFGNDMQGWLGGELNDIGYHWAAGLADPRLLGLPLRAEAGLFAERKEAYNQDFGTNTWGGSLSFTKPWDRRLNSSLGFRLETRDQYLLSTSKMRDVDPDTLERRVMFVTTPSIRYDSRDSFLRPRKGLLGHLSVDVSTGLKHSVDNFIKYTTDLRGFYSPLENVTIAARLGCGYLQPYGTASEVPRDQLFFLGGTADVRGFGENLLRHDADGVPVGGRLALNGSLEARYDMGRNFELTLFVDGGSVREADAGAGGNDDPRWSAGLGLRYITPVGPIGVLYGHKLDQREKESAGHFHFTMGYTF